MTKSRPEWPTKDHVLVRLTPHPLTIGAQKDARPVVTIDGIERECEWGDVLLPYWDERPVTISIDVPSYAWRSVRERIGRATATLPPGTGRTLEYAAPPNGFATGAIGALGLTSGKGAGAAIGTVAVMTVIALATAVAVTLGIVAATVGASGQHG